MQYFLKITWTVVLMTAFVGGQRQGDLCVVTRTGQPGVCRHIMKCPVALEAAFHGIPRQECASPENRFIVCCPWLPGQETGLQAWCQANTTTPREGDNCTMVDTGRAGVCSRFASCQTAKDAAFKGISPQICAVEGNTQIICCPLVTVAEGDQCLTATGRTGKCLRISKCPIAVEAALKGKTPQICALDGSVPVVCCEGVVEGDSCTVLDTGKMGVCRPFANCQTAKEAAFKGILPQACDVEGTVQTVCCPLSTIVEGSQCVMIDTGRAGVCRPFANCQTAKEASYKGILPQTCDVEGTVHIICCPLSTVVEGSNCTMVDTEKTGVCRPFANCQTAKEASYKGILPQTCDVEGTVQIICCPLSTVVEGDNCTVADTGRAGVCRPFANCQLAKEASYKGISPQTCDVEGTVQIICCPLSTIVEGSNCTMMDTGRAGVCRPFSNCQTAREASYKGILPQICDVEGTVNMICCPISTISEGNNCTLKHTEKVGVCRPFANCHSAQEGASKGILPQKCDLTDNESELVCCTKTDCPPLLKGLVTQLPIGSKAADYCIELAEKIHPCQETRSGWTRGDLCPLLTPDSNILYHRTPMTTAAEAPYFGRFGTGQRGDITWQGEPVSLVSDQWVLCSAAAIHYFGSSNVKFVGLGGTFTPRYNPDEIYGISTKHIHPLFNHSYSLSYNNIALLQLDRRVTFTARILPVCLHTGTPLPDSGFIQTDKDGKATMQKLSQEECSRAYPTGSSGHPAGVKHDQEICSRPVNTTRGCPAWNDGSPLTLHNSHRVACTHLLVGLKTSWTSSPCTVTNIRISSYTLWIEGIVWP